MGKWNRRYLPRKKYRSYDCEAPHMSVNWEDDDPSYSSGVEGNRVPSWEIDYCKSARVPWNKVMASKKYIYCYPTVLNWDGSASKEALENAKKRYWAMINNLPCDIPLPDPDMYIHEIDWNVNLDPELMEDLDRQFFNPDESCSIDRLGIINENVASDDVNNDKNQPTIENPWERNIVQGSESSKNAVQGWGQWGNSLNLKNESPWEQSCNRPVDSWNDNAWKGGNESTGWDQPVRQEGWGERDVIYQGWNQRNDSGRKSTNFCSYKPSWENKNSNGREWRENGNQPWGRRDSEFHVGDSNGWDSNNYKRSGTSFRGGCRKRESSVQYTSNYKSSRYQGYNHGDSRQI